jgi:hypothetical protein
LSLDELVVAPLDAGDRDTPTDDPSTRSYGVRDAQNNILLAVAGRVDVCYVVARHGKPGLAGIEGCLGNIKDAGNRH